MSGASASPTRSASATARSVKKGRSYQFMKLLTISLPAFVLSAALLAQAPSSPQTTSRPKIDVSKLGPQVGERVPAFALKDQNGNPWTIQSIMGPKGAMLVFVRSADW